MKQKTLKEGNTRSDEAEDVEGGKYEVSGGKDF